jgi:hypothetical protein
MSRRFRGWSLYRFIDYLYGISYPAKEQTPDQQSLRVQKQNGQRQRKLMGCAASTAPDRDGTVFSEQVLAQMVEGIVDLPVLLDGKAEIFAVVGEVVEAHLAPQPDGIIDLMVTIELLFSVQEAERVWRIAEQGIAIGLDIGVAVHAEDMTEDNRVIRDAEIVEVIMCTTPRQPRSRLLKPVSPWGGGG